MTQTDRIEAEFVMHRVSISSCVMLKTFMCPLICPHGLDRARLEDEGLDIQIY